MRSTLVKAFLIVYTRAALFFWALTRSSGVRPFFVMPRPPNLVLNTILSNSFSGGMPWISRALIASGFKFCTDYDCGICCDFYSYSTCFDVNLILELTQALLPASGLFCLSMPLRGLPESKLSLPTLSSTLFKIPRLTGMLCLAVIAPVFVDAVLFLAFSCYFLIFAVAACFFVTR